MRLWTLAALVGLTGLLATGCPKPEEVGHAPKKQIEKAEKAVEKLEVRMEKQAKKANAAAESAAAAAQAADEVGE